MKYVVFSLLLLPLNTAFAQDMKTVEQGLREAFHRIDFWNAYSGDDSTINRYDSLVAANTQFQQLLMQLTAKFPATLQYDFPRLKDSGLIIVTSRDQKLRTYSWNSYTGGSMRIYERVFQYRSSSGVFATDQTGTDEHDDVAWIWKIVPFHAGTHTYYLFFDRAITCGVCRGEGVKVYSIGSRKIEGPLSLFKSDGQEDADLSVEFREFGRTNRSTSGHAILYDSLRHTFQVPSTDDINGTLTDRYTTYKWTGSYFVKQ